MINTAVSVQHVTMELGGKNVLTDVTHDFEEGKVHGIAGNNGSGKTVLLKCICGFLAPTQGKILVDFEQIGRDADFPEDVGLIIEKPGFLPGLSGLKNLQLLASHRKKVGYKEITKAMRHAGLDPKLKTRAGKYPDEMRQRLGIAQAVMEDPSLLILDEPFGSLDKQGVTDMQKLIRELGDSGKTILLTGQSAEEFGGICDTVCGLDAGRLAVIL